MTNAISMNITLENQVAVITGGSRGIGAATVKIFAEAGAKVVFSYRRSARRASEVVKACGGADQALAVRANAAQMAGARRLVATAIRRFGRIDILVANAGVWNAQPLPIEKMTERKWDETLAINLKGAYAVIHYAVPQMIRQKGGRIVSSPPRPGSGVRRFTPTMPHPREE